MRNSKGQFVKGHTPWHKGKTNVYSSDVLEKMRLAKWKGDDVGYVALHEWIRKAKGRKGVCEFCGNDSRKTDMANISGEYKRVIEDWVELCKPCHYRFDHKKAKNQYGEWDLREAKK